MDVADNCALRVDESFGADFRGIYGAVKAGFNISPDIGRIFSCIGITGTNRLLLKIPL